MLWGKRPVTAKLFLSLFSFGSLFPKDETILDTKYWLMEEGVKTLEWNLKGGGGFSWIPRDFLKMQLLNNQHGFFLEFLTYYWT